MSEELRDHAARGAPVHLLVSPKAKIAGNGAPFLYLGEVVFRACVATRRLRSTSS